MGRGRKGVMTQSNKKIFKRFGSIANQDNQLIRDGIKLAVNQTSVVLPEDFLNDLRQMNPSVLAKTLMNM